MGTPDALSGWHSIRDGPGTGAERRDGDGEGARMCVRLA